MTNLNDKKWNSFFMGSLFTFERGQSGAKNSLSKGKIPLVSARNKNNGWGSFVDVPDDKISEAYTLSVNNNGDGGAGLAYFQETKYTATQDVTVLTPKHKLSKYTMLFLARTISMQQDKFGFGNKANATHLKIQKIMLPVDSTGKPDWQFMEDFISDKVAETQARVASFEISRTNETNPLSLKDSRWNAFPLNSVVTILSGKRLTKKDMDPGTIPFIGSTDSNNGITAFSSNNNESLDHNTLGVNYNGSVVNNFYHPYQAIFSDDVKRLHISNISHPTPEMYLFLKVAILKQKHKYQYGYKFNAKRMGQQKIMLPVNECGEPDWKFMENYIKSLPNADLI